MSAADLPPQFDRSQFNPVLMWTEYLNRLLGVTVGFSIFATAVVAIRHYRHTARILWPTLLAFLLVGFEGWLGGVVVKAELEAWIVTAHLVVALIIVLLLLYATLFAFFQDRSVGVAKGRRAALVWTTAVLIGVTLLQIGIGAQVRAGVDDALGSGVVRDAALATVGPPDRWHRDVSLLVLGVALVVLLQIWQRHEQQRPLIRAIYVMVGLVVLQLFLGVTLAYLSLTPAVQIVHLTAASLLLGAETVTFLLARWLP